jgi:hypothetical protein
MMFYCTALGGQERLDDFNLVSGVLGFWFAHLSNQSVWL